LVIIGGYPFLGIGTGEQVEQLSGKGRLSSVEFINRIAILIFLIENAVGINILPFDGKGLHKNKLLIIEEVILCANKAKNVTIVELR